MTAYILKSAIAMAVLLVVYYLFLEKEKMHRFNRFYLLGALAFSLVVPFISIPIYVETAPIAIPQDMAFDAVSQPLPAPTPEINYWLYAAIMCYTLVTLVLAIRFARNIIKFYSLKKCNTVAQYNGATLVLLDDDDVLPHTFLNNIYLSKKEYEHRLIEPELLTHELAHVRQRHTVDILYTELLKTVFWFNPLPWLYKRAIQMNHEFLADESTIVNHHLNIPTYQQMLLDKATPYTAYALASSINFSITKKRFIMMTKTTSSRKKTVLQAMLLPVLALTSLMLCYEVVAQQPKTSTQAQLNKNTTADRDEYYSNVQVIINDKARNVSINKKYEALTTKEKDTYITDVPKRGSKKYHYPGDTFILNISKVFKDDKIVATQGYKPKTGATAEGFAWPPSDKIKSLNLNKFSDVQNDSLRKLRPELYPTSETKLAQIFITYENDNGETVETTTFLEGGANLTEKGGATVKLAAPIITAQGYEIPVVNAADTDPQPEFPGGIGEFYRIFGKEFKFPDIKKDVATRAYVSFIIEMDGSMSNIKILKDPGYGMGAEVERVLKGITEKWKPGMVKGKPVRTSYSLPISLNIKS